MSSTNATYNAPGYDEEEYNAGDIIIEDPVAADHARRRISLGARPMTFERLFRERVEAARAKQVE